MEVNFIQFENVSSKLPIKHEKVITTGTNDFANTPSLSSLNSSYVTIVPARQTHKHDTMMIWVWATNVEMGVGDPNRLKLNI